MSNVQGVFKHFPVGARYPQKGTFMAFGHGLEGKDKKIQTSECHQSTV